MKEDLILESFKQYHNANWHDGDNTFDERTYAKSNGDTTSSDADFDDPFVQDCYEHYEAGYEKAYQEQQLVLDSLYAAINEALDAFEDGEFNYCHKTLMKSLGEVYESSWRD